MYTHDSTPEIQFTPRRLRALRPRRRGPLSPTLPAQGHDPAATHALDCLRHTCDHAAKPAAIGTPARVTTAPDALLRTLAAHAGEPTGPVLAVGWTTAGTGGDALHVRVSAEALAADAATIFGVELGVMYLTTWLRLHQYAASYTGDPPTRLVAVRRGDDVDLVGRDGRSVRRKYGGAPC